MISLHSLLFISLLPLSITIHTKLQFVFVNGFNIIRCSNSQIQVFQTPDTSRPFLNTIIQCNNKEEFSDGTYSAFAWGDLSLICSSSPVQVHEEQSIHLMYPNIDGNGTLPAFIGQLNREKIEYELKAESLDDGKLIKIKSNDQLASNELFTGNAKRRVIYLQFPGHPTICRIQFSHDEEDNSCSSGIDQEIDDVGHVCYYNPGAETEPTSDEMEAELEQVMKFYREIDKDDYVLNLDKPVISADNIPAPTENIQATNHSKINPGKRDKKKYPSPINSSTSKNKSSPVGIVGIVLGLILLLALVGGVAFYLLRKTNSNQSSAATSPSAVHIEAGNNKDSARFGANQSEQSSEDDSNHEIPTDDRLTKDKPKMELQPLPANKRQRPGNNLAFKDDI